MSGPQELCSILFIVVTHNPVVNPPDTMTPGGEILLSKFLVSNTKCSVCNCSQESFVVLISWCYWIYNLHVAHWQTWTAGQRMLSQILLPSSKKIVLPGEDYVSLYTHSQHIVTAILAAVNDWRKNSQASAWYCVVLLLHTFFVSTILRLRWGWVFFITQLICPQKDNSKPTTKCKFPLWCALFSVFLKARQWGVKFTMSPCTCTHNIIYIPKWTCDLNCSYKERCSVVLYIK